MRRCASKSKVSTPALEAARPACSKCSRAKAIIRGYAAIEHANGRTELEIELKYFDGEPVIREIARVSKPGRRVYASVKDAAARQQRPRHLDPVDAEGRDGRSRGARRQCRRRSSLHGVLTDTNGIEPCLVLEKNRSPFPLASPPAWRGRPVKVKGPKGALQLMLHDDVAAKVEDGERQGRPASSRPSGRAPCGAPPARWSANLVDGVTKGFERSWRSTASAIAPRCRARTCSSQLGYSHDVVYPIPEGITIATAEADRDRHHRASTRRRSARWRRKSVASGRPSPTRARA